MDVAIAGVRRRLQLRHGPAAGIGHRNHQGIGALRRLLVGVLDQAEGLQVVLRRALEGCARPQAGDEMLHAGVEAVLVLLLRVVGQGLRLGPHEGQGLLVEDDARPAPDQLQAVGHRDPEPRGDEAADQDDRRAGFRIEQDGRHRLAQQAVLRLFRPAGDDGHVPDQIPQDVELMDQGLGDQEALLLGHGRKLDDGRTLAVGPGQVAGPEHGHRDLADRPDLAFSDPRPDLPEVRPEAAVVVHHQPHDAFDLGDQLLRLGQRVGQGLLAEDVDAPGGGHPDVLGMAAPGGGDVDDVQVVLGQHLGDVVVIGGNAELGGAGLGLLDGRVGDGHDLEVRNGLPGQKVVVGDAAGPGEADLQCLFFQ